MIVTERTRDLSLRARFRDDSPQSARRVYSYDRAGYLWVPPSKREILQAFGGGPCGAFASRAGGTDDRWQPTSVAGFVLDLHPRAQFTLDVITTTTLQELKNNTGSGDSFINLSKSLQPLWEPNGWTNSGFVHPSFQCDGLNDYLACTTSLPATIAGGNDTAFTLFDVGQHVTLPAGNHASVFFGSTSSTSPLWDLYADMTANLRTSLKRDDTAAQVLVATSVPDTLKHVTEVNHTGTFLDVLIDGISAISAAQNVGTLTVDAMTIGATYANSVPANWANRRYARVLGFTGSLGAADASYVRGALMSMYL